MLRKNASIRPDRQLEKMLISLVYALVMMTISLMLLFVYPQYSLYLLSLVLFLTVLSIGLAISVLSASEEALTYGGFANEILNRRDVIRRIDNNQGLAVIENEPAKKFFGGNSVLEKLKSALFDERQNQLNFQRLELALKGLKKEKVRLSLQTDKGESWYEVGVRPLYLKKSDIFEEDFSIQKIKKETYFLWSLENVTAARNMEKIFEEERKKLHTFIHHMPVGIYIADASYRLEYVNETFARQLSLSREELQSMPLENLLGFDTSLINPHRPSYSGMTVFKNETGDNFEMFVLQNNFKDGNDIKIRGLTLKELPNDAKLTDDLNYAADKVCWLFDNAPVGILFVNEDMKIELANNKAAEIFGSDADTLSGQSVDEFFEHENVHQFREAFEQLTPRMTTDLITKAEMRLKSNRVVQVHMAPRLRYHSEKEKIEGLIVYIDDLTEQKNLELRFAQAQKMQAMGQLAGGVAHDFNNLLTAMIGFCDLLLQRHGIGDPSFADLIQIKQNANRAAGLVRQLLAFSRKQPLKPKRIDITENFVELSHLLKRILGEQITLEFNHGRDLGYVRVDPVQFSQVIINLAVNAKDAMNGKGRLKISTRCENLSESYQFGADTIAPGEFVVISVEDNGCGIPEENISRIFEPFFSTKQNVAGSGTGLGLAMVYGIVRQTEGFIKVKSTLGKGTVFSIHLPRFETADEDKENKDISEKEVSPVLTTGAAGPDRKMIFGMNVSKLDHAREQSFNPQDVRILFVEDEESVRAFGVRALKRKGFSVTACNCAENAIELLDKGENFDLLVTDMVMPGLSGADLAKEIKRRLPAVKIILASGYSEEIARRELAGSEDFAFISKPYSLGDLTKKVFDVLSQ